MCLMLILMLNVLCVYLIITISYHRNGIMEECVRIVAEHPRTAETILPEISFLNYQYILLESEVAVAT